jgi:prenyltransferase beta subunit
MGGFSKLPNSYPDLLHSFYSLIWLSMEQEQALLSGDSSTLSHDACSTINDYNGLDSAAHEQFGLPISPLKPIDVLLGIPKDKSPRFLTINTNPTTAKCYN